MARERKSFIKINFINLRLLSFCVALVFQFKTYETKSSVSATLETLQENYVRAWPFLAALYRTDLSKFFCGGTLISSRHILTAAHCVHEKYSENKIQPDYITVLLGADDVTTKIVVGARQREVKEVHVHPDWSVYSDRYDADVAILFLSESVIFTKYIGPVCVPTNDDIVDGATGSIVGWELTDTDIDNDTLLYTDTRSHASHCLKTHPFPFSFSPHTFCTRNEGKIPNKVVSGGGFFIRSGTAWLQYGIDLGIPSNATTYDDTNSVSFYTNVQEFSNWIANTVRRDGYSVTTMAELSKVNINFDCVYMDRPHESEVYECWVFDVNVQSENGDVASITGNHLDDNINGDVKLLRLINGTMLYIPNGIGKIFKNLQGIYVGSQSQSSLLRTKIIKRSNFKHMTSLYKLLFYPNDIESVDEDALWELPMLEDFFVVGNKLKVLPERLFEKNLKLLDVDLRSNQLEYLPRKLFQNNVLLERVDLHDNSLKLIDVDFTSFTNIKEIWLYDNICISILYDITSDDNATYLNQYRNLTDFQSQINTNCKPLVESKNSKNIYFIPKRIIFILGGLICSLIATVVVAIRKKSSILNFCKGSTV